ncbi:hypothetical protein [Prevotella communis]|uniref:hypothetical protein n=1 Tax=Prevotella communis TaxID=2913614 RepID=UPI001EDBB0CD|nr:hypothetical protein [Prevotella communis]UKK55425.1 hypothetical protein L6476_08020 [Prevotella communis]
MGESLSALELYNCRSSISIHSSVSGDGTHGGLVSTLSGSEKDIYIDGCVFDGSFATTAGTNNCGGFVGWPVYNRPVIENSLMIPASVGAGMLANTFTRVYSTNEPTITNCYYVAVDNLPANQGTAAAVLNITPANPDYDYGMVKAYKNGIWFDGNFYGTPVSISLADNADNSTTFSNANGYVANVTLSGRTLYKDGYWNTLVLPFDVTIASGPLAGDNVVAKVLSTTSKLDNGTLTLNFDNAPDTIPAGTPFIIKWDNTGVNLVNPVFTGVTIDNTNRDVNFKDGSGSFKGTYAPLEITEANRSKVLLLSGNNKLGYAKTDRTIANKKALGTCRAYFYFPGSQTARSFVMNFGEDETTSLREKGIVKSEEFATAAEWYTLDGVKLSGKPTKKGLYIHGGKKVLVH